MYKPFALLVVCLLTVSAIAQKNAVTIEEERTKNRVNFYD